MKYLELGVYPLKFEIMKQTKMINLNHSQLCIQEYLLEGNANTEMSKLIFRARGRNLDIKEHKRWKYADDLCMGCQVNLESENELLSCPGFTEPNETSNVEFGVFGENVSEMVKVAKEIRRRLKIRDKLMDNG
jgi:hypothetical protein